MVGEGEEGPRVGGSGPLSFKYHGCRTQTRPLESPLKEAHLDSSLLCLTRNTAAGDPDLRAPCSGNVVFLPLPQWPQPARDRRDTSLDRDGHTSEARGQGGMLSRSGAWLMDTLACSGCLCHLVSQPSCLGFPSHRKGLSIQAAVASELWPLALSPMNCLPQRQTHTGSGLHL